MPGGRANGKKSERWISPYRGKDSRDNKKSTGKKERGRERKGAGGKRLYCRETGCRICENNTAGEMEKNGPGIEFPSTFRSNVATFHSFGIRRFNPDNFGDTGLRDPSTNLLFIVTNPSSCRRSRCTLISPQRRRWKRWEKLGYEFKEMVGVYVTWRYIEAISISNVGFEWWIFPFRRASGIGRRSFLLSVWLIISPVLYGKCIFRQS